MDGVIIPFDREGEVIEVTLADARRCNRLRGLSVATCGCRTASGWQECPPAAHLGVLDDSVIRDCARLLATGSGQLVSDYPPPRPNYSGDICEICGGMVAWTGTCRTCQSCGSSSGGCS